MKDEVLTTLSKSFAFGDADYTNALDKSHK